MIVGMTSGTFDLFHSSHLVYLERCKSACDKLIVGVDSDELVKSLKGDGRPIFNEHNRLALVNSVACVDAAFCLHHLADLATYAYDFEVDIIFKCDVWRGRDSEIYGVKDGHSRLIIIDDIPKMLSTSRIVEHIRNGEKFPIPTRLT